MKKISLLLAVSLVAVALSMMMSGVALANYGPHGGYGSLRNYVGEADFNNQHTNPTDFNPDTDACAGCHRAHTAVASVTWTDSQSGVKNALLIGTTASTIREFCYTCHGDNGFGAATNVQAGIYDNTAGRVGAGYTTKAGYGTTSSTAGAVLNGGGFDDMGGALTTMSSWHEVSGANGTAWGGSTGAGPWSNPAGGTVMKMDCCECHDPHGSSNYRILKDKVNGVDVGGYLGTFSSDVDPNPNPYVISNEVNYPATGVNPGFRLHRNYGDHDGNGVVNTGTDYMPDYTTARYAMPVSLNTAKGMSGWCAACHTQYNTTSSSGQLAFNAADGYGTVVRHRHPVNQPLNTFYGDRALLINTTLAPLDQNVPWGDGIDIPLDHDVNTEARGSGQRQQLTDYLECLTCHRAHGTNTTMSGFANSNSNVYPQPDSGSGGVPPAASSALLRANNRGVCERCHNK